MRFISLGLMFLAGVDFTKAGDWGFAGSNSAGVAMLVGSFAALVSSIVLSERARDRSITRHNHQKKEN